MKSGRGFAQLSLILVVGDLGSAAVCRGFPSGGHQVLIWANVYKIMIPGLFSLVIFLSGLSVSCVLIGTGLEPLSIFMHPPPRK